MRLSIIVARTTDRVIGRAGKLPWHLPADLMRFKRLTMGHHLIMGRKTFESLGRPLPGRTLIVLTRRSVDPGCTTAYVSSLDEALQAAAGDEEVFVAGGAEIYGLALPRADRIYQTIVHADVPGDTYFPPCDMTSWTCVETTDRPADDRNPYAMTFEVWDR